MRKVILARECGMRSSRRLRLRRRRVRITYGTPDCNAHPEVGALLAPQAIS